MLKIILVPNFHVKFFAYFMMILTVCVENILCLIFIVLVSTTKKSQFTVCSFRPQQDQVNDRSKWKSNS